MRALYITLNRLTVRLEALGHFLFASMLAAWLCYAILVKALPPGEGGSRALQVLLVFLAGFLLALPVRLFLRRGALRRLDRRWTRTDRQSRKDLLAMVEALDNDAVLLDGRGLAEYRERLRSAFCALDPADHTRTSIRILLELALATSRRDGKALAEVARALGRIPTFHATRLLNLWNRASALGVRPEASELEELYKRSARQTLPRRLRGFLPLLYSSIREEHKGADRLLLRLLKEGGLRAVRLPVDIGNRLRRHPDAPPVLRLQLEGKAVPAKDPTPRKKKAEGGASFGSLAELLKDRRALAVKGGWLGLILLVLAVVRLLPTGQEPASTEAALSGNLLRWTPPDPEPEGARAYTIQILASKDSLQAVSEARRLVDEGIFAFVQGPRENSRWYRVRVGWFDGRSLADSSAVRLQEQGLIQDRYTANYEPDRIVWQAQEDKE